MRRVLVDTNIYVAYKRGEKSIIEAFRNLDYIAMDITVIAELLSGFKCGSRNIENQRELAAFLNNPRVFLIDHNYETAEFYSSIYYNLRLKGKPIPTNDIWIAAAAMQNGLAIYSLDKHYYEIDGLLIKSV